MLCKRRSSSLYVPILILRTRASWLTIGWQVYLHMHSLWKRNCIQDRMGCDKSLYLRYWGGIAKVENFQGGFGSFQESFRNLGKFQTNKYWKLSNPMNNPQICVRGKLCEDNEFTKSGETSDRIMFQGHSRYFYGVDGLLRDIFTFEKVLITPNRVVLTLLLSSPILPGRLQFS